MTAFVEAREFLHLLGPSPGRLTFQTFANAQDCSVRPEILHGTIDQHLEHLRRINAGGAGIYVMINEGDGVWRSNENVTKITNLFLDLDGSSVDPVLADLARPHAILETSPGHYQVWWRIQPIPVTDANRVSCCDLFHRVQRSIADRFGGDRHVSGLCGVARIPGFLNMKNNPFLIRVLELNAVPEYPITTLIDAFGIDLKNRYRRKSLVDLESLDLNLDTIPDGRRNATLFNILRNIGYRGILGEALLDIGLHVNDGYCDPPKTDDHVRGIVCRVTEYCLKKGKKRLVSHGEYVDLILATQHLVYSHGYFFRYYTEEESFRILDKRALVNRIFQASNKKASRLDINEVLLRLRSEISNRLPGWNPEVEFIRTMLREGGDQRCSLKAIHDRYETWCVSKNVSPLKKDCLSAEIGLRTGKKARTIRQKKDVFWGYAGLCLK